MEAIHAPRETLQAPSLTRFLRLRRAPFREPAKSQQAEGHLREPLDPGFLASWPQAIIDPTASTGAVSLIFPVPSDSSGPRSGQPLLLRDLPMICLRRASQASRRRTKSTVIAHLERAGGVTLDRITSRPASKSTPSAAPSRRSPASTASWSSARTVRRTGGGSALSHTRQVSVGIGRKSPAARRALLYCVPSMFDSLGVEVPFTT